MPQEEVKRLYIDILDKYTQNQSERNLYVAQNIGRQLIQENIAPEEVINIHKAAIAELFPEFMKDGVHSFDFLIEIMIQYGLAHREHQSLLQKQHEIQMEIDLAANVQETLLKTKVPSLDGLEIGLISVPARKMNGDYIHFLGDDVFTGVAVTDVIGKGIPAALCMSMVKNGMDTLEKASTDPSIVLDVINRIVEKSVNDDMFISMFYGRYDAREAIFTYASAGHEPALFYNAAKDEFLDLDAKGLLLGVIPNVHYLQHQVKLNTDDIIVIMTDGVTECRSEEGFIERSKITSLIHSLKHEPAQVIVDTVYKELEKMQDFQLRDDLTLVVFKKTSK